MNFGDIGEGSLYWCAHCGPEAQAMDRALSEALATRGSEFVATFTTLLEKAEAEAASYVA
jgi:hypothetical protein